ncbi:MAG: hypothetical protein KTR31_28675 [Myxococcales bacterium]|nr:hypothetical protein [Myxococcales bacterium]
MTATSRCLLLSALLAACGGTPPLVPIEDPALAASAEAFGTTTATFGTFAVTDHATDETLGTAGFAMGLSSLSVVSAHEAYLDDGDDPSTVPPLFRRSATTDDDYEVYEVEWTDDRLTVLIVTDESDLQLRFELDMTFSEIGTDGVRMDGFYDLEWRAETEGLRYDYRVDTEFRDVVVRLGGCIESGSVLMDWDFDLRYLGVTEADAGVLLMEYLGCDQIRISGTAP